MERRIRSVLIASILIALVPTVTSAQEGDITSIDFVDIGDPASEAGHNLYGWGPIEPETNGGTWGHVGEEDGTCRVISFFDGKNISDWARFTMDFGGSPGTKYLLLRHMDGYADDSFYVYVDELGEPGDKTEVFYYADQLDIETWLTANIPLDLTGVHTIYMLCAQPEWSGSETYEQVAFTWASVVPGWVLGEEPTAITLTSFTAQEGAGSVTLTWETATEIDNAGFNLYRATSGNGSYTKINTALIAADGDPVSGASYSFRDERLAPGTYYYKLEDVDYYGVTTMHGPVSATIVPRFRRPAYRPTTPEAGH